MKKVLCLLAILLWIGTGVAQDGELKQGEKKEDEKTAPTHSKNLDTKNIEATALYLNRVALKLQQLEAEATRTGNTIKYNEFNETVQDELSKWTGAKVRWTIQVESVSGDKNGVGGGNFADAGATGFPITPICSYLYKNKAKLNFSFRSPAIRLPGDEEEPIRYDRAWAKTLKRMDFMVVEGKIINVTATGIPAISVQPNLLEKFVPAKK